jgi:hypothetical protein
MHCCVLSAEELENLGTTTEALEMAIMYAQAEAMLAAMHGATGEARTAFRGRLQHLRRLGIPLGVNPGRGKHAWYSDGNLWEWALALELAEAGLDPAAIARFVRDHWKDRLLPRIEEHKKRVAECDLIFIGRPSFMAAPWAGKSPMPFELIEIGPGADPIQNVRAKNWLSGIKGEHRRALVINVTDLLRSLQRPLTSRAAADEIYSDGEKEG